MQPGAGMPSQAQAAATPLGAGGQVVPLAPNSTKTANQVTPLPVHDSPPKPKDTTEDLKNAAAALQSHVSQTAPELQFSVDKDSGHSIITITDLTTNTVIQQIPSEEALRVSKEIDQYQKKHGLLLDRKA